MALKAKTANKTKTTTTKAPKQKPGKSQPAGKAGGKNDKAAWAKATASDAKTWKEARKAKAGEFSNIADLEDGTYVAKVAANGATFGISKKDSVPWFKIRLVVSRGPREGIAVTRTDFLKGEDREGNDNSQAKMEYFAKTIQGFGYDTEELEMSDIPTLAEELNANMPTVQITVKNGTSEASSKPWQTVYVNKLVDEDSNDE